MSDPALLRAKNTSAGFDAAPAGRQSPREISFSENPA